MEVASFTSIFQPEYLRTTIFLSASWFMINFMYYGQLIILPFIFGKEQMTFLSYVLTILGEAPTLLVSLFLVDR